MSNLNTLFLLIAGYIAIWVTGYGLEQIFGSNEEGWIENLLIAVLLPTVAFYPMSAVGYFFSRQLKDPNYKPAIHTGVALAIFAVIWIFFDRSMGGGRGYDGFKYWITVPIGFLVATITFAVATLNPKQHKITRILGCVSIATIAASIFSLFVFGLDIFFAPQNEFTINIMLTIPVFALLSLFSAAILPAKTESINAAR